MAYDFPNAPLPGQVFQNWTWDSEKWVQTGNPAASGAVRFDLPQGLNTNQMAQGRANIGDTKKNYIINGGMMVSQENGTTAVTSNGYPVDMFNAYGTVAGTSWTVAQVASLTPAGSPNRIRFTVTATGTPASGTYTILYTGIEGLRAADLKAGTAAAKTVTIQFGVKAPAGTYCVSVQNSGTTRSYVAEYVIAAGEANTDVVKSVTLAMDTAGTWVMNNTAGVWINFCLGTGATSQTSANTWTNGLFYGTSNQFNWFGTVNNVFELFDVSLTEGSIAPPFQVPDYATELAACKRYYVKTTGNARFYASAANQNLETYVYWPVQMRATPTLAVSGAGNNNLAGGVPQVFVTPGRLDGCRFGINSAAAGDTYAIESTVIGNARL